MGNQPVAFLVDNGLEMRKDLIAALESAGLRVETFKSVEEFTSQYKGDQLGCLLLNPTALPPMFFGLLCR